MGAASAEGVYLSALSAHRLIDRHEINDDHKDHDQDIRQKGYPNGDLSRRFEVVMLDNALFALLAVKVAEILIEHIETAQFIYHRGVASAVVRADRHGEAVAVIDLEIFYLFVFEILDNVAVGDRLFVAAAHHERGHGKHTDDDDDVKQDDPKIFIHQLSYHSLKKSFAA